MIAGVSVLIRNLVTVESTRTMIHSIAVFLSCAGSVTAVCLPKAIGIQVSG